MIKKKNCVDNYYLHFILPMKTNLEFLKYFFTIKNLIKLSKKFC